MTLNMISFSSSLFYTSLFSVKNPSIHSFCYKKEQNIINTSKRPARKRKLISNQAKRVIQVKIIFIIFFNILLLSYLHFLSILCCFYFLFI